MQILMRGTALLVAGVLSVGAAMPVLAVESSNAVVAYDKIVLSGDAAEEMNNALNSAFSNLNGDLEKAGRDLQNALSGSNGNTSGTVAAAGTGTVSTSDTPGSWMRNDDGSWSFLSNGNIVIGWVIYGQQWYRLGIDGKMLTGWQFIDGKWYYFAEESVDGQPIGSMYVSRKTPDGYTVNANGVWDATH